jgi:hypothetical protein
MYATGTTAADPSAFVRFYAVHKGNRAVGITIRSVNQQIFDKYQPTALDLVQNVEFPGTVAAHAPAAASKTASSAQVSSTPQPPSVSPPGPAPQISPEEQKERGEKETIEHNRAAAAQKKAYDEASKKLQSMFTVLVPGQPPLTAGDVAAYVQSMEWALEVKFTESEVQQLQQSLVDEWTNGTPQARQNDLQFEMLYSTLPALSDEQKAQIRNSYSSALMQQSGAAGSSPVLQMLIRKYTEAHSGTSQPTSASAAAPAAVEAEKSAPSRPALASNPGGGASSNAKLAEGMLNGVYAGFHRRTYSVGFDPRFLVFYPSGIVIYLPPNGLAGFDLNTYLNDPKIDKALIGRYRDYGNYISVIWQDSPSHRDQLVHNENGGLSGYDSYSPAVPSNGLRFSGVYLWGSPHGIQFNPDGTFFDQRATDLLILPNPHFNNPRAMGGTYQIQDNTILLIYQDGSRTVTSFVAPAHQKNGQTFDWIALHGSFLYRQGYQPQP